MFCLRVLDVEEGVVSTGEESAGLLVVVIRESIGGGGLDPEAPYGSVEYVPV